MYIFAIGGFMQNKDRDTRLQTVRSRFNLPTSARQGYDQFTRNPGEFVPNPFPPAHTGTPMRQPPSEPLAGDN